MDKHLRIQDLPESERPYEKMERHGVETLSESELLSIVLCSGGQGRTALDQARILLSEDRGLSFLRDSSPEELQAFPGIGRVKALRIKAGMELALRLEAEIAAREYKKVCGPHDVTDLMAPKLKHLSSEEFHAILLDVRHRVIRSVLISRGGLTASVVRPRDLFREAIRGNAAAVILCHNHPSGDAEPSEADIQSTARFSEAGLMVGIPVLDHIIIGKEHCVSLKSRGLCN